MKRLSIFAHTSLLAAALLMAPLARAADPPAVSDAALMEAQMHFTRGVDLYAEADYPAAQIEFRRAYDLIPNFRVLYNLGRVSEQQHDYAAAFAYYRKYLADGAGELSSLRQHEVEASIAKLQSRVGQLEIVVNVTGAEVAVDDVLVGVTPLDAPVVVNVGRRRVTIAPRNAVPVTHVVDIAGEETLPVTIDVHAARDRSAPQNAPISEGVASPPPSGGASSSRTRSRSTWLWWSATATLAAGSAVAGVLAMSAERDLRALRDSYPASLSDLQRAQTRTRTFARVADGCLAGALVMSALSLYFTFDGANDGSASVKISVGPAAVALSGRF